MGAVGVCPSCRTPREWGLLSGESEDDRDHLELPSTARFEFKVDGVPLVGRVFSPPAGTEPVVQAVLTGPLTSVKEQATGAYAAALAARGFIALAFDHRTFGESGGEPRQFEDPFAKIEDIRAAASALLERGGNGLPLVGVGVCAGAGYMARAVAEDPRFEYLRRCRRLFR